MTAKVVTIAQQKGGSGKTTLATHLAVCMLKMGKKVAIIDADPQQSLFYWYNARKNMSGLNDIKMISSIGWRIGADISDNKSDSDLIIIDSPPQISSDTKAIIRSSDLILIPIQMSPPDIWASEATIAYINQEDKEYLLIPNRVNQGLKLNDIIEEQLSGKKLAKTKIGNRTIFAYSMLKGQTSIEIEPNGIASNEIKSLSREVWSALKKAEKSLAII